MSKAADRHRRASSIFAEICDSPNEVRPVHLESLCGGDAELQRDVERMLTAHDESDGFLDRPAMGTSFGLMGINDYAVAGRDSEALDPYLGREIGRCAIQRLIARGGMSSVYEARQPSPDRLVAIKIMRRSIVSKMAMKRFAFETRLLARIRHPGIAQVYETGVHEEEGWKTPYFVMELIPEARSITEHALENELDIEDRLRLLAEVCDAVQAGHRMGIIHRDLKPSNILIDGDGRVKVIDFGVARSTGSDLAVTTQLTETGQLIGTLQYMSPEQCGGDPSAIDTRSDVFSLGVVLHEVLLGTTPTECDELSLIGAIERKRTDAMTDRIDPVRRLPRRLRAILHTAMAASPDRRYETAAAMATDLRAYCNGEQIVAAAPGKWERLVRQVARHPILTTAAICVLMIAGSTGITMLSIDVMNNRPDRVEFTGPGTGAAVFSLAGNRIIAWDGDGTRSYHLAEQIKNPSGNRKGGVLALGVRELEGSEYSGELVLFKWGEFEAPYWRSGRGGEWISAPANHSMVNHAEDLYSSCWGQVADVFPESPGDEIIVSYMLQGRSRQCIRVIDCSGITLYEAWHDGVLKDGIWLPDAGLIVCVGVNSWADWVDRGQPVSGVSRSQQTPRIAFAIKPEYKQINTWIEEAGPEPTVMPLWYYSLTPGDAFTSLNFISRNALKLRKDANGNESLICSLNTGTDLPVLGIRFSATGNVTAISLTDPFKNYVSKHPEIFGLTEFTQIAFTALPPIITEAPVGMDSSGIIKNSARE